FWLTFGLVRVVIWYERKDSRLAACQSDKVTAAPKSLLTRRLQEDSANGRTISGAPRSWRKLSLQLLQGKWSCVTIASDSRREHKMMQIEQEQLFLTVSDFDGKVHSMSKAEVKLGSAQASRLLMLSPLFDQPCDDTLVSI